jgi:ubiquinone/menaquinone biosynthesis C-methylase UbiE
MDAEKNLRYIEQALSGVPEDFSGKLLEVPVGTGVLTMPLYKSLPEADVTCLDYSTDMMARAEKRAAAMAVGNVRFRQGDVGALPFADESFDIVLSLNGFHAFPDKEAAYRETRRVLRKGGIFCGCFYIAGEFARTDFFVKKMYVPKGFFTPPFETKESLESRLKGIYREVKVHAVRAEGIFRCVK